MIEVLHVIQSLSGGGATRAMLGAARYSGRSGGCRHRVLPLLPPPAGGPAMLQAAGVGLEPAPTPAERDGALAAADVVLVHFWNSPELYRFLGAPLPPMRLAAWLHVAGDRPPQVVTPALMAFVDLALATAPCQYDTPAFRALSLTERDARTALVLASPDFARLAGIAPKPHPGFNVGYVGTVDAIKMHPAYVRMSAAAALPDARFIVCGTGGQLPALVQEAARLGVAERFEFRGQVENIRAVLEVLDVFGYPLCADNYSTSELALQEAMYAGVPAVVFAHGGAQHTLRDGETGLIVRSESEYREALEFLHRRPDERARLGANARRFAARNCGAERTAAALDRALERLMEQAKRPRAPLHTGDPGTDPGEVLAGARGFCAALGPLAPEFGVSLRSGDIDRVLAAEARIARASPALRSLDAGGILHYRTCYPTNSMLRLWTGLVFREQGQNARAFIEFRSAIEHGLDHWRVHGYLADVARRLGAAGPVREALAVVRERAPAYMAAFAGDAAGADSPRA